MAATRATRRAGLAGAVMVVLMIPAPASAQPAGDFRISDMGPDGNTTYGVWSVAVAYNSRDGRFLVVWGGDDDSATLVNDEFEIYGQLIDAKTGAEIGADFRISDMGPAGSTSYEAAIPGVAYNPDTNEFLVVWVGDDDTAPLGNNEFEVFGQFLRGDTGAEVGPNDFRISDMGPDGSTTYRANDAAVAYSTTSKRFLVAWYGDDNTPPLVDNEFEVFGQLVDGATRTQVGVNDFRISSMGPDSNPNYFAGGTAVAYNPDRDEFLVVWNGDDDTPPLVNDEFEVFGQRLRASDGSAVGADDFRISDMGPDGSAVYGASQPAVGYGGGRYLVAWAGDDGPPAMVDNELEVYGQLVAGDGAGIGPNDQRLSTMGPDGNVNFSATNPAVGFDPVAGQFLVAWVGVDDRPPLVASEIEILGQRVRAADQAEVGTDDFRISDMGPDGNPAYAAFGPDLAHANPHLVVWSGDDDTAPLVDGEFEAFGRYVAAVPDTVGLVDPAQGRWHLRNDAGQVTSFFFGNPGDVPVMGDWDCDGVDTPGLFRQSDAFAYLSNANRSQIADIRFFFGNPSDVPLAGDWNGDGCDTLSIYRPGEQRFYIVNALGQNEGGLGPADFSFGFGNPGDKPVVGDWDGDGVDEVGLHRESTGFFYWRDTLTTGIADGTMFFGDPGDRFVAGDWGDVDGADTPAVFRPSGTTFFFRHTLTQGNADASFPFGEAPWLPVAGTFGL